MQITSLKKISSSNSLKVKLLNIPSRIEPTPVFEISNQNCNLVSDLPALKASKR